MDSYEYNLDYLRLFKQRQQAPIDFNQRLNIQFYSSPRFKGDLEAYPYKNGWVMINRSYIWVIEVEKDSEFSIKRYENKTDRWAIGVINQDEIWFMIDGMNETNLVYSLTNKTLTTTPYQYSYITEHTKQGTLYALSEAGTLFINHHPVLNLPQVPYAKLEMDDEYLYLAYVNTLMVLTLDGILIGEHKFDDVIRRLLTVPFTGDVFVVVQDNTYRVVIINSEVRLQLIPGCSPQCTMGYMLVESDNGKLITYDTKTQIFNTKFSEIMEQITPNETGSHLLGYRRSSGARPAQISILSN